MQVLILVAGESKRLRPLTEKHPKSLLPLDEKEILHHILDVCQGCGLNQFHLLTGHGHQYVADFAKKYQQANPQLSFNLIFNEEYATKGNIHSLYTAKGIFHEDFILINSDTIFHKNILQSLINAKEHNVLVVDDFKKLSDEEMKVYVNNENKIKNIHKSLNPDKSHGEYIGLLKICAKYKDELIHSLEEVMRQDPSLYYEDALQHLIDKGVDFHHISTGGLPAMEIDTHEDLEQAKKMINKIHASSI